MKRNLKNLLIAFGLGLLIVSSINAGEIDGFRSLKWGDPVDSKMVYVRTDSRAGGGVKYYRRPGDEMRIGGAKLVTIEYGFWRNKFYIVEIVAKGASNLVALKEATVEKFGPHSSPLTSFTLYLWDYNPKGRIMIHWTKNSESVFMTMSSKEVGEEIDQATKNEAREGAATGF